jgi:hypothetical protein
MASVPPYGSLSPADEHQLCAADYPAWVRYIGQGAGPKIVAGGEDAIRLAWAVATDEYKKAVWGPLNLAGRKAIRSALSGARSVDYEKVPA